MNVFSYKIVRDYGFAPNPFHGVCTLATCKPGIRKAATEGDLIVGCGSTANKLVGRVIFMMKVEEILTFDDYWNDPRFVAKRPRFNTSLAHAYGDNIYHRAKTGEWVQERSHHSLADGSINELNLERDTRRTINVLLSSNFSYFGREAPLIPANLRSIEGEDLYPSVRDYRRFSADEVVRAVKNWFDSAPKGYFGRPSAWH